MVSEKQRLEMMESQMALELPDREMLGLIVFAVCIGDILSGNTIVVNVSDINTATQVCALVSAINVVVDGDINNPLYCDFKF